jgi:hypothetical protein
MDLFAIACAVWRYASRTLAPGTPAEPATRAEFIARAFWRHEPRTLTAAARVKFAARLARRSVRTADLKCGVSRTAPLARRFTRRTEI